ncbi:MULTISPECIES: hypothetical protein [Leptospira]|uniref:Uncharacterized protein n=1 Tax=Leptospira paudalimensis TaxID=2950024 RepID=A0ABT3M680_9LEPT|nr:MULTISPECIES: hypothetical protein [Leptospira]MCG6146634.1 hypothetical protein [Leptospira bandrabouensis]MCG6166228.1 hypothetical protein [Leptospira bandrabouensis]MCW7503521.1 hypothetical protein [Leptospira paudalimensis]
MLNYLDKLPYQFKEQITNYVQSVKTSTEYIFKDAHIKYNKNLEEKLLRFAAIKKTFAIVSSTYWSIYNNLELLKKEGLNSFSIGSKYYSQYSKDYLEISEIYTKIESILEESGLKEYIYLPYNEVLIIINEQSRNKP